METPDTEGVLPPPLSTDTRVHIRKASLGVITKMYSCVGEGEGAIAHRPRRESILIAFCASLYGDVLSSKFTPTYARFTHEGGGEGCPVCDLFNATRGDVS